MGHPDKITPDVIEWILSDEGVVRRWEGFCARLGLGSYKERIDGDYEPRHGSRRRKLDRQKMKELLEVWQRASPITYTRSRLMDILHKEGCHDMYMFLQLMNSGESPRKNEIAYLLSASSAASSGASSSASNTPRSTNSLSPQPPFRPPPMMQSSSSTSPYTWYFDNGKSAAGATSTNGICSNGHSSPYPGILKKSSSSVDYLSRESTPDSGLGRIYDSVCGVGGGGNSGSSSKRQEPIYAKVKKGIRFADDVEDDKETVTTTTTTTKTVTVQKEKRMKAKEGRSNTEMTNGVSNSDFLDLESLVLSSQPSGAVEKYFDNLVTMIEDAAEGL